MRLFKNKYKARIEAKIKELETERWKIVDFEKGTKQTIDPKTYAHYVVLHGDLSDKIKLLKDLLI